MASISKRIKAYMNAHRWSAPQLAEYSGVPLPSIKSILYGHSTNPRASTLQALADAFSCPVTELLKEVDTGYVVIKPPVYESRPVLGNEELVKAAIRMIDHAAIKLGIDLSDQEDLKTTCVEKLVAFAMECAKEYGQEARIDPVFARWLLQSNA